MKPSAQTPHPEVALAVLGDRDEQLVAQPFRLAEAGDLPRPGAAQARPLRADPEAALPVFLERENVVRGQAVPGPERAPLPAGQAGQALPFGSDPHVAVAIFLEGGDRLPGASFRGRPVRELSPSYAVEAPTGADPEGPVAAGVQGAHGVAREALLRGELVDRVRDPQEPSAVGAQPERPLRL